MRRWFFAASAAVVPALLLLGGCTVSPPTQPTQYSRLVIDTYLPNTFASSTPNLTVTLFGSAGTVATSIASGTYATDANPDYAGFTRISYAGGLGPGTYYVRVKGSGDPATDYGAYAIRILTADPVPAYATAPGSPPDYFPGINGGSGTPDSYEADDAVSGGIPTNPVPISLDGRLNRYIQKDIDDVDWFVITLP
jgi:hypothetical protein